MTRGNIIDKIKTSIKITKQSLLYLLVIKIFDTSPK